MSVTWFEVLWNAGREIDPFETRQEWLDRHRRALPFSPVSPRDGTERAGLDYPATNLCAYRQTMAQHREVDTSKDVRQHPERRILVTGGAGCIGSALCRYLVGEGRYRVINVDKLNYAGNFSSLESISGDRNYRFEQRDIAGDEAIGRLLHEEQVDSVIHLAAQTHVDRSIASPSEFIETNIVGTFRLLQTVLEFWRSLDEAAQKRFRFHYVSTDEVFGDVVHDGDATTPDQQYRPSSPYSASKAAAEHLVSAWHRTYGLPVIISNSSNNYGPYQFPDKLIPLVLLNAIGERPLPVYGTGANVRSWLYVDDHARALERVLTRGRIGDSYCVSVPDARTNIAVVHAICELLDKRRPRARGRSYAELIAFVPDRPGHDRRYAMDPRKAVNALGWVPEESFETGLAKTVDWYLENSDWWLPLRRERVVQG